jgi:hypothetical protein
MTPQAARTDATRSCFFIVRIPITLFFKRSGKHGAPHASLTLDEFLSGMIEKSLYRISTLDFCRFLAMFCELFAIVAVFIGDLLRRLGK